MTSSCKLVKTLQFLVVYMITLPFMMDIQNINHLPFLDHTVVQSTLKLFILAEVTCTSSSRQIAQTPRNDSA